MIYAAGMLGLSIMPAGTLAATLVFWE